jgi:hypothetical protein
MNAVALNTAAGTQRRRECIPREIRDSMRFVRKRFQFNIEQIEKRYSMNSSGLVFNLGNDEVGVLGLFYGFWGTVVFEEE